MPHMPVMPEGEMSSPVRRYHDMYEDSCLLRTRQSQRVRDRDREVRNLKKESLTEQHGGCT
jgi:hypothetical protein